MMTQQLMQQQLRQVDPTSPAASLEVPTVRYIQGVQGDSKRIWSNSLGPYDSTEEINDLMGTTESYRCIVYQRDDPDAVDEPGRPQAERERTMWYSVYSTPKMIDNARGSTHGCIDAKWCTCSDGSPRTALLVGSGRTEPKPGEAPIPESSTGGYTHYDMDPAVVITSNTDNYFCPRIAIESIRRLMPCDDLACSHPVVRKERAHGRRLLVGVCALWQSRRLLPSGHD